MDFDLKRLYELLPAIYRIRDAELALQIQQERSGGTLIGNTDEIQEPLKALFSIIAEEIGALEENLDQLYDDQFIETCAEWVVPYIGNLVGTRSLIEIPNTSFSQRSEVANTIKYRRRKGTASVIEQLARDVTGWDANVVEYFQLLATTQYLNHLRPQNLSVSGLKDWRLLEYANTPFDKMPKTVNVRRIERQRGKYNIQNVGVFLWRIKDYSLTKSPIYKVDAARYTFDALGKDTQLYHHPIPEKTITQLAKPLNVAMPISRRILKEDFEIYYGEHKSLMIYINDEPLLPENFNTFFNSPVAPISTLQEIFSVCNLSDLYDGGGALIGWANMPQEKIAIDPVLGRIAFPSHMLAALDNLNIRVKYHYGFSSEMGGGEYERTATFENLEENIIEVSAGNITIQNALNQLENTGGVVEIQDNEYYVENLTVAVAEGKTIEIRAANGKRPVLILNDYILINGQDQSKLIFNGLLIGGAGIRIGVGSQLELLKIIHCTLVPSAIQANEIIPNSPILPRIIIESFHPQIEIEKSITGALRIVDGAKVFIKDSIIDATEKSAVAYAGLLEEEPGGVLHIHNSTVIGKAHTLVMAMASNTIFVAEGNLSPNWPALVMAQRLQEGCVRFSYFPPESKLPRPYHCQPEKSGFAGSVKPLFTSLTYGDPEYCQLHEHCVVEITQGADDESEMGAFHHLYQAQRVANLRTRLDEYLRFGLEAGIFYAS